MEDPEASPRPWQVTEILGPKKMSKVLAIMFYSRQLGHLHRPFLPWSASITFLLAAVPSSTALHCSDEGKWEFESPFDRCQQMVHERYTESQT